MNWIKTSRSVHGDGSAETRYEAAGTDFVIESRKRPIPHANGIGSWMFTSYHLIFPDGTEKMFHRLMDAKEAAEKAGKHDYKELSAILGSSIEDAVNLLLTYRETGELACINFNGFMLYSDSVTMDGAYKEITGMTRAEYQAAQRARREAWEREEAEHKAKIPQLTLEWEEKGHSILDKQYWDLWDRCVPIRLDDLYRGMELGCTLEIVEKLNAGCDFSEAQDILNGQGHSGMSYSLVCSMIKSFCDRGAAFVDAIK